ncbi:OpgC domain-containing protein [Chelativorans sp. AA-79]|uniref:OpgC family protein n=1 Tax=Chelativorans sp. AA-79 TaxID=3028735 RepID=UPI0023F9C1BA|nr:OpgC domain-containing protein [Chelativorans sp. AA-79]WEX10093.1 OpgC domain-containing protein [Chelativorans sp. AA-79]
MTTTIPPQGIGRDHRLDVFRGLALVMIFVNHVPGNVFENLTSRNFGFSDAAEAFVLMSGIAVGLAYARLFRAGEFLSGCMRVWRRAGTLYVTHIVTTAFAIAILAAGVVVLDTIDVLPRVNFTALLEQPLKAMIGIPLLTHQLGYLNILPLYSTLLLVSPLYILIGLWSRMGLIAVAIVVWVLAGTFRINLPNYPLPGGWFFNPVSWQLIYAIGIACGLAMIHKRKLIGYHGWLFSACLAYLAFSLLWVQMQKGNLPLEPYLPFFVGGFDKTFLALPRLLHVLALAYVLTNLAAVSRFLARPAFRPVELIGQYGLAVFAVGTVLSIALQVYRARFETSAIEDGALLAGGLLIQYGVARLFAATSEKKRGKAQESGARKPSLAGNPAAGQASRP